MAPKIVTFESKFGAYNIVRQPKVQVPLPNGTGWQTVERGKSYQFQPVPSPRAESGFVGVLTVKVGQDKLVDAEDWLKVGADVGPERDVVDALQLHREFGADFWIQGHAPGTLYPRPAEFRREVTTCTAKLDDGRLAEMIAEETRTHGRAELIAEAQDALDIVAQMVAEAQAETAEAEPKPAAKPKPKAPASA